MDLNQLAKQIYQIAENNGFWGDIDAQEFQPELVYIKKLCLIHSEASEVLEAMRDDNWDKVPEELADILIRTLDLAAGLGYDIQEAVTEKIKKNALRPFLHNKAFQMSDWPSYLYPSDEDKERNKEIVKQYMERHDPQTLNPLNIEKAKILIEDAIILIENDPDVAIEHLQAVLDLL